MEIRRENAELKMSSEGRIFDSYEQNMGESKNIVELETANNEEMMHESIYPGKQNNRPRTKKEKLLISCSVFLLAIIVLMGTVMYFLVVVEPVKVPDSLDICNTEVCKDAANRIQEFMDTSMDPCNDFYQYACGGWIDKHSIPDDKGKYSVVDLASDQLAEDIIGLLNTTRYERMPNVINRALTLFHGCINKDAREKTGIEPLKLLLKEYQGWPMADTEWNATFYHWDVQIAKLIRNLGLSAIISVSVVVDFKDTSRHIIYVYQSNFELGKNMLININSQYQDKELVMAYKIFMKSSSKLLNPNYDEGLLQKDIDNVVEFESSLAKLIQRPIQQRNISSDVMNKMTVAELQIHTENGVFSWKDFLNLLFEGYSVIDDSTEVIVTDIDYVRNALKLVHSINKRTVSNYIGWKIVSSYGPETTMEFQKIKFDFQQAQSGFQKMLELHHTCLDLLNSLFGFAVGRLYVDKHFPEEAKADVESIIEDSLSATYSILRHNEWLDETTKSRLLNKLKTIASFIAYPQWIKENEVLDDYYGEIGELNKDTFFSSVITSVKVMMQKQMQSLGKQASSIPQWKSTPVMVNAFYNPIANTITFPAGILTKPFYYHGRPWYLNSGGIGSVIGHEISHGFGDAGSHHDQHGNVINWWSQKSREKFDEKLQCFRNQYSSYMEPLTKMHLNGENTIEEDIADNEGLRISFIAYKLKLLLANASEERNKKLPKILSTPDQLFFIGYANNWCTSERKVSMEMKIKYSKHSPNRYRVLVPLSNFKAFSEAFKCPPGSPMNPKSKCVFW